MKKVLYTLAALSFVFVACNKQEIVPEEGTSQEGELTTVTIKASNGDADTKAAIADETRAFTWTIGDQIAVHTDAGRFYTSDALTTGGATADFTVSLSGNRDGFAVYPASVAKSWDGTDLTLTLPNTYTLAQVSGDGNESPLPMIAKDEGGDLSFKHVAGLLRLTISNIPTGTNKIKLDFNGKKVSGDFTISSPTAGTSTIAAVSGTKGTDDIIWITDITGTADLTVNIPLPTGATYSDLIVSAWDSEDKALRGQVVAFNTYTPARAHGKKLSAALNLGAVSIASGKYAVFAPGNLQATISGYSEPVATASSWKFADHQYDYLGNGRTTMSSGSGTVDLFAWQGKSSTEAIHYGLCTVSSASAQWYGNNSSEQIKADWGSLSISYGDQLYAPDTWRTPTGGSKGEWKYLLESRSASTVAGKPDARFARAKYNSSEVGIIIFPDNYSLPIEISSLSDMINYTSEWPWNYINVNLSNEQMNTLINSGAVYLPGNNNSFSYWSKTCYSADEAYYMGCDNYVHTTSSHRRYVNCSVRLIRDL